jgi:hypothetical protein
VRQVVIAAGLLLPLALDTFALAAALGMAGLQGRDRLRVMLVFKLKVTLADEYVHVERFLDGEGNQALWD